MSYSFQKEAAVYIVVEVFLISAVWPWPRQMLANLIMRISQVSSSTIHPNKRTNFQANVQPGPQVLEGSTG